MITKNLNPLLKVLLLVILMLPASCKKGKNSPPPDQPSALPQVSIANKNVEGMQIISISVANYKLDQVTYTINIGNKTVTGVKTDDQTLSFLIPPDLASGSYEVKVPFASNTINITVTAAAVVANPQEAVANTITDLDAEIQSLRSADTSEVTVSLSQVKQNLEESLQKFNALPDESKQVVAQFLAVNLRDVNEGEDMLAQLKSARLGLTQTGSRLKLNAPSDCNYDCYAAQIVKVVIFIGSIALGASNAAILAPVAVVIGIDIGLSIFAGKKSVLIAGLVSSLKDFFTLTLFPQIEYLETTLDNTGDNILSGFKNYSLDAGNTVYLLKGKSVNFKVQPVYRTLQRTDGDKSPAIASFIAAYDALKAKYNSLFGSAFGPCPTFTTLEEKRDAKKLSDWEVQVTSGNVTATAPSGTPADFSITFNSTENTTQNFEFDLIFHGPVEDIKQHVSAKLIPALPAYQASVKSGNNQSGQLGKTLPNKLEVLVVNSKGDPVENVKVLWATTAGGGTITAQSTTNASGVAQADWTLGASGAQTAQAVIKKDDGTDIIGSPVLFTATDALPAAIAIASGNHQDGQFGKKLPAPISVKVTDDKGNVLSDISVQWDVISGGGIVSAAQTTTDASGIAKVDWTLGNSGTQQVSASAKKKDGTLVANAPVTFDAGTGEDQSATYRAAVVGTYIIRHVSGDPQHELDTKAVVSGDGTIYYYTAKLDILTNTGSWSIKRSADGYRFVSSALPDLVDDKSWGTLSIPVLNIYENIYDLSTGQPAWRSYRVWIRQ